MHIHALTFSPMERRVDLTRPAVDIVTEEMALREVSAEEGGDLRELAVEAVYAVNRQLLGS